MTLSLKHVQDICLLGNGEKQCRYLASDDVNYDQFHCLKHKQEIAKKIDNEVNKQKSKIQNPNAFSPVLLPLGDNCKGYPILKNINQGYDVKP